MPAAYDSPLSPYYEEVKSIENDLDPRRIALAATSPLTMALHLDPSIVAYPHTQILDYWIYSLTHCTLYPDGPGERPDIWVSDHELVGKWTKLGSGLKTITGDMFYRFPRRRILRPGANPETEPEGGPNEVVRRLNENIGPRYGKSVLSTIHTPRWFLLIYPMSSVLVASYSGDFAEKFGAEHKEMAAWVEDRIPVAADGRPLHPIQATNALIKYREPKDSGEIQYRGVGGATTGTGFGHASIDDPFKDASEAQSETVRASRIDWFDSVISTRPTFRVGVPPPQILMLATRWNEMDLTGSRVYEEGTDIVRPGWASLVLKSVCEDEDDPLGRDIGETLCPARIPRSNLMAMKDISPMWFQAMHQGSPNFGAGNMFMRTYGADSDGQGGNYWFWKPPSDGVEGFQIDDVVIPKEECTSMVSVDLASSTKTTADWSVLTLMWWHAKTRTLVVEAWDRRRMTTESHKDWLLEFTEGRKVDFVGVEDKTFGTALIGQLHKEALPWPLIPLPVDRDKVTRAMPAAEACGRGKLWLPKFAPELVVLESEMSSFPNGAHDDMVDTLSQGYNWLQNFTNVEEKEQETDREIYLLTHPYQLMSEKDRKEVDKRGPTRIRWGRRRRKGIRHV